MYSFIALSRFFHKFNNFNLGLYSVESTQHPSINQSTDDIIESAATTVKDTAGAVKNLAQSLLRVITPELGKEGRKGGESPQNLQNIKVKNLFFVSFFLFYSITTL